MQLATHDTCFPNCSKLHTIMLALRVSLKRRPSTQETTNHHTFSGLSSNMALILDNGHSIPKFRTYDLNVKTDLDNSLKWNGFDAPPLYNSKSISTFLISVSQILLIIVPRVKNYVISLPPIKHDHCMQEVSHKVKMRAYLGQPATHGNQRQILPIFLMPAFYTGSQGLLSLIKIQQFFPICVLGFFLPQLAWTLFVCNFIVFCLMASVLQYLH